MASVAVDVCDVINVGLAEVSDSNCTDAEKEFITVLAAIYAVCYPMGGSAVGLSYYDVVTSRILWKINKIMSPYSNLPQPS